MRALHLRSAVTAAFAAACFTVSLGVSTAVAEVKPHGMFASNMVLQREAQVPVWGSADPGEKVTVSIADQSETVTADAQGRWRVNLKPMPAGGPHRLVIKGTNTVTFYEVLVGDVWLCSGQSNMAMTMEALRGTPYEPDIEASDFPMIRHAAVAKSPSLEPVSEVPLKWHSSSPKAVTGFTAAGYYFARQLHTELKIPIGLVHSSWGGTSAEAWTSVEALNTVPDFKERAGLQIGQLRRLDDDIKTFRERISAWESANGRADTANEGEKAGWAAIDADPSGWTKGKLNTKWNQLGMPDGGIGWLRKEFELAAVPTKDLRLDFGLVDEQYVTVYVNGQKVGESGKEPPEFYAKYVQPVVPAAMLRQGKNVLTARFVSHLGEKTPTSRRGVALGFSSIGLKDVNDDLLVRIERKFAPLSKQALADRPAVNRAAGQRTSSALYNGMIQPLVPFAFKGVLWYQGEQDASRARAYRTLLPLMINDWRSRWTAAGGVGEMPFLIQQLPNWQEVKSEPEESAWAELREAQYLTAKNTPKTYLSVGIDLGEVNDVHPRNKRDIGKRLALVALERVYGKPVKSAGPVYASMSVEGSAVRLRFATAGGLKTTDGGPLRRFQIAGKDRKWVWGDAKIDGDSIVVSAGSVPEPVAVRYAWANSPEGANLTDSTGLPAMPFRTDEFPGVTDRNK